jgi:UPF0755 protein
MRKSRILLLALCLLFVLLWAWYRAGISPANSYDETGIPINVTQGSSVRSIASLLAERGLIRSSLAFRIYAKLHRVDTSIQAGTFLLRQSMSVPRIIETLRGKMSGEGIITIPEGFTVADIDALLAAKGITKPGEILACARECDFSSYKFLPQVIGLASRGGKLEGYLFPDTYFILREQFSPKEFLERLLTTFQKRVVTPYGKGITASGHTLHEIVTLASLIEEETRTREERPIVSGILWKRLEGKMGLDVDATIRYILEKPNGALTKSDLAVNSPYNTRRYRGLPPGPIANPGIASILAAMHPEESPYLYYLHDREGNIHYAKTNDEHNANKAKYLQ